MPRKFKTQIERVHVAPGERLSTTSEGVGLVRVSPYTWQTEKGERLIAWNVGRWTAARVLTTESVMAESVLETASRRLRPVSGRLRDRVGSGRFGWDPGSECPFRGSRLGDPLGRSA